MCSMDDEEQSARTQDVVSLIDSLTSRLGEERGSNLLAIIRTPLESLSTSPKCFYSSDYSHSPLHLSQRHCPLELFIRFLHILVFTSITYASCRHCHIISKVLPNIKQYKALHKKRYTKLLHPATTQRMPPQSPSSVAPSHSETCNLCSRDTYGCHCGGTFRQPSLLLPPLALAHEQQQDPFTDEHALQPEPQDVIAAGNDTPGPAAAGSSSQQASDDGLPSGSLPSRHTISAQPSPSRAPSPDRQPQPLRTRSLDTARLLSQAPPPLAPQAPTSEQVPLATIPLLHLDLASPRSRNSPKRQPTILHPPFTPRSEIAPIYSAGEHTWQMERSRQDLELFRTPSIGVLAGRMSTVRAARAVTGQKKPFPLIAPVLAQEKQKSTTEDSKAQEREHSEVDGSKESRSRRLFLLIVLLFQLCLLAATTAVVIWIKDLYGKQHVLRASTVSVAVIGGAGCCACGLWGRGVWLR